MFEEFNAIIEEMRLVYLHDQRPWLLGFSGGKDSTLLCQLTFEMLKSLKPEERTKKVYIVTSDYVYQAQLKYLTSLMSEFGMYNAYLENSFVVNELSQG